MTPAVVAMVGVATHHGLTWDDPGLSSSAVQAKAHGAVKVSNLTGSMIHECSFNPQDSSLASWQHLASLDLVLLSVV